MSIFKNGLLFGQNVASGMIDTNGDKYLPSTYLGVTETKLVQGWLGFQSDGTIIQISGEIIKVMCTDGEFLYVVGKDTSFYLYKFTLDGSLVTFNSTALPSTVMEEQGMAVDDEYLYLSHWPSNRVRKYNKSTLAYVAQSESITNLRELCVDDTHLYVISTTGNAVIKILKSTMATVATSADQGSSVHSISQDADYIYMAHNTTDRFIRRLNKSDLSTSATSAAIAYGTSGSMMAIRRGKGLIFSRSSANHKLVTLDSTDLSIVAVASATSATTGITSHPSWDYAVGFDGTNLIIIDKHGSVAYKGATVLGATATNIWSDEKTGKVYAPRTASGWGFIVLETGYMIATYKKQEG